MNSLIKRASMLCAVGMSLSAGSASADPACVEGDVSENITSGSAYCGVQAFGQAEAYKIELIDPRQDAGGYGHLRLTRVARIPGDPGRYQCGRPAQDVHVLTATQLGGVLETVDQTWRLNACFESITLPPPPGAVFYAAACQVTEGCQAGDPDESGGGTGDSEESEESSDPDDTDETDESGNE